METRRKASSPQPVRPRRESRDPARSRSRLSRRERVSLPAAKQQQQQQQQRRYPHYNPLIELRQVSERLHKYSDWSSQDELFETTRRERQRYEQKQQQKRVSQSLNSSSGLNSSLNSSGAESCFEMEDDENVLLRRQRDLDKAKNLGAYANYVKTVPKPLREKWHPRTPNKFVRMSRRAWDGSVKQWKLQLHRWQGCTPKSSRDPSPILPAAADGADGADAAGCPLDDDEDTKTLTAKPEPQSNVEPEALHSGLTSDVQQLSVVRLQRKRSSTAHESPSKKSKR